MPGKKQRKLKRKLLCSKSLRLSLLLDKVKIIVNILAGFVYEKVYAATKADPAFCAGREDAPPSKMRQLLYAIRI